MLFEYTTKLFDMLASCLPKDPEIKILAERNSYREYQATVDEVLYVSEGGVIWRNAETGYSCNPFLNQAIEEELKASTIRNRPVEKPPTRKPRTP